jgi:AraC family transcriptional regulator
MTDDVLYADRFAKLFPMIRQSQYGTVKSLQTGTIVVTRMTYSGPLSEPTLPSSPAEAFALCLRLEDMRAEIWSDGRHVTKGGLKDETSICDLRRETIVRFHDSFDFLCLYLPHSALNQLANELDVGRIQYDFVAGANFFDPTVAHLGRCLLPMLDRPHEANELFVGHVAMALNTHLLRQYATGRPRNRSYRSGLAPWQLRTAKALMRANLNGEISLARIASECGLSAAHFARAFRISTGAPPHRWLLNQRIQQSKALMVDSTLSLTEIAIKCGFSDQSHFTRAFTAAVGTTPGRWRLIRKA